MPRDRNKQLTLLTTQPQLGNINIVLPEWGKQYNSYTEIKGPKLVHGTVIVL
jgi:hypothetical protein